MKHSISQKFGTMGLIKFVLPSVIMMVFVSIYSMLGSVFAGKYIGEYALSAVNVVFPFISLALAVAIMFATGANAIISANLGANDFQKARENFSTIAIVAFVTGVLFTMGGLYFDDEIIHILGGTESIAPYAKPYLRTYCVVFPFMFLDILSQYFFITESKGLMGMTVVVIAGLLNIVISFVLVAVLKLGIGAIALGSAIAYGIPALLFLVYFWKNKHGALHFVKPKLNKGFLLSTCANGSSEMVTNLAIAFVAAVMNIIMGNMVGDNGLAAVSVIVQVQFLLNSMYIGFGAGIAPIFGFAYGSDNREQTKNVFRISVKLVAITSIILVGICLIFNKLIVSIFIDPTSASFKLANTGFIIFSLGYFFAGMNIFASVFFTSVSNGKISAAVSFLRTFVFILGMFAILPTLLGTTGVWISMPIAEALALIVSIILLKKYRKVYHY